jgi:predicted 3-demethylubiquinone-9 3-methyltransferase (glyoxalase superfamily)
MRITPFLMFQGAAEEAMNAYVAAIPGSSITSIERYGPEGPGKAGTVKRATLKLLGLEVQCIDSPVAHAFTFTPASSLFVDFDDRAAFDAAFEKLGESGQLLMPPANYGFSTWFAWVQDRFGVSWQLNLP